MRINSNHQMTNQQTNYLYSIDWSGVRWSSWKERRNDARTSLFRVCSKPRILLQARVCLQNNRMNNEAYHLLRYISVWQSVIVVIVLRLDTPASFLFTMCCFSLFWCQNIQFRLNKNHPVGWSYWIEVVQLKSVSFKSFKSLTLTITYQSSLR